MPEIRPALPELPPARRRKLGRTQQREMMQMGNIRVFMIWRIISVLAAVSENISPSFSDCISEAGLRKQSRPAGLLKYSQPQSLNICK